MPGTAARARTLPLLVPPRLLTSALSWRAVVLTGRPRDPGASPGGRPAVGRAGRAGDARGVEPQQASGVGLPGERCFVEPFPGGGDEEGRAVGTAEGAGCGPVDRDRDGTQQ